MKNNIIILLLFVAVTLVSSCKKEYLVDVSGNLSGKVYDQFHNPIEKAIITVEGTSLTDSTDAGGAYTIKKVPVGKYNVSITKPGYTSERSEINIESSDNTNKKKLSYEVGVAFDAKLYAFKGTAKGYISYSGNAVANAKVVAYWNFYENDNFVTETFETTTDANGFYSFAALPIIDYTGDYYSSRISIAAYDSQNADLSGSVTISSTSIARSYNVSLEHDNLRLISYTGNNNALVDTTAAKAAISLTFNQNVSSEITNKKRGDVFLADNSGNKIVATVKFTDNKIVVTPAANLRPGQIYRVYFNVYATEYKAYSSYISFNTTYRPGKAMTIAPVLSINANKYLVATETPNAIGYEIWQCDKGSNEFYRIVQNWTDLVSGYDVYYETAGSKFYMIVYNVDANSNKVFGPVSNTVTR